MAGYIDREALARKLRAEADKCKVGEGDTLAGLYLANCIVDELPAANVVLVGKCKDCAHWTPSHIEKDGKFVRERKPGEFVTLSDGINVGSYCTAADDVLVHGFRDGEPSTDKTKAWMSEDDFCSKFERREEA